MKLKTAVLLINLGTPDSPSVKDVRKYLFNTDDCFCHVYKVSGPDTLILK